MELVVLEEFEDKFNACLDYALVNFGRKTVRKWKESFQRILKNLQVNPEMYPFVPELRDCQPNAHSAIIMKNFKLIFIYDEQKQVVMLVDLWSMSQDSDRLRRNWKIIQS